MTGQFLEPRPQALAKVDHIVVLMLENRSFDNLLGWLYDTDQPPRGQHFEGLRSNMWAPLSNIDPDGIAFTEKVFVRKNGAPVKHGHHGQPQPSPVNFRLPDPDPGEGFRDTNEQLFGHFDVGDLYPPEPTCMGFVDNYAKAMLYGTYAFGDAPTDPRSIMTTYTPEQVPVLSTLARQFAVCDAWHASVPSQTLPNRDFIHAATSNGQVNNKPQAICDAETIFNRMQDAIAGGAPLSWRVYGGTSKGKLFSLTRTIMSSLHDPAFDANFVSMDSLADDAAKGNLPSYAFLEPQLSGPDQNDQHPNADIRPGDKLIADVYEALSSSPAWEKTLFVVTYDEHGGGYDHVPPPGGAMAPDAKPGAEGGLDPGVAGQFGFRFNRFGVRVPAVLVSPLIEAGTVARPKGFTPFDHTSVISTITHRFGLAPLTMRDKAAPDLSCVLTLDTPRTDKPAVTPLDWKTPGQGRENDLHQVVQEVLTQLTGMERPSTQDVTTFVHAAYEQKFGATPA
jgi:phospholipase C